jgi:hypothetical protein
LQRFVSIWEASLIFAPSFQTGLNLGDPAAPVLASFTKDSGFLFEEMMAAEQD